jgi:hypothetical protein
VEESCFEAEQVTPVKVDTQEHEAGTKGSLLAGRAKNLCETRLATLSTSSLKILGPEVAKHLAFATVVGGS